MSNQLPLLRLVVITSSLFATLVLGDSLQKRPTQSIRSPGTISPKLSDIPLGVPFEAVSFTQAIRTSFAQASPERSTTQHLSQTAKEQVSGPTAIPTPTPTHQSGFQNLTTAAPTTFTSVPHSISSNCGQCTIFAEVHRALVLRNKRWTNPEVIGNPPSLLCKHSHSRSIRGITSRIYHFKSVEPVGLLSDSI